MNALKFVVDVYICYVLLFGTPGLINNAKSLFGKVSK
jgi:hypothetical protein